MINSFQYVKQQLYKHLAYLLIILKKKQIGQINFSLDKYQKQFEE
ncbi:hypothetical protein pb186bvf_016410 [Paramecium bursaria]